MVGSKTVFFMDEISTGLDSSTTYAIVKFLRDQTHALNYTTMISLLQPAPESYDLFDDILLLAEGMLHLTAKFLSGKCVELRACGGQHIRSALCEKVQTSKQCKCGSPNLP